MSYFLRNLFFKLVHPDAVQCANTCGRLTQIDNTLIPICDSCIKELQVFWEINDVREFDYDNSDEEES